MMLCSISFLAKLFISSPEDFAIVETFCFMDTIYYLFKKERLIYNYTLCKVLKVHIIAAKLFIWVFERGTHIIAKECFEFSVILLPQPHKSYD